MLEEQIKERYNQLDIIWHPEDNWHLYTKMRIESFLNSYVPDDNRLIILNAGSGGENHGLNQSNIYHIDLAENTLKHIEDTYKQVGSIEKLPYPSNHFDVCICVGSVINYCDPVLSFLEITRVLKPNGLFILEYESSKSFEYIFTPHYNQKASLVTTFYQNKDEVLWVYAPSFITKLASMNNLHLVIDERIHTISAFLYRIGFSSKSAAKFVFVDKYLKLLPFLSNFSSNRILSFQKILGKI